MVYITVLLVFVLCQRSKMSKEGLREILSGLAKIPPEQCTASGPPPNLYSAIWEGAVQCEE